MQKMIAAAIQIAGLVGTHEVEVCALHEVLRERCGESEVLPLVALHLTVVDQTCHKDGSEEADTDTDDKGGGETADRTSTEDVEDDTGDQRRQVRVEDGREGVAITLIESLLQVQALAELFLGAQLASIPGMKP